MTVNELIKHLEYAQRAGRGDQTVFLYRRGDTCCMRVETVNAHHSAEMGHVVLKSEPPIRDFDLEPAR